ncbi:MAG: serine hydrolase [Ignavibacteria bacterium]|nr:serine hydrolase [Ignavibacteria bacterium]
MKKSALIIILMITFRFNAYSYDFSAVDDIVSGGIINNAFPGAQLLIGNKDDILYSKCYGNYTYDEFSRTVTDESVFDLASITKVVATTSAIMKLYEQQKFNLTDKVSAYIPEFGNNGKEDITILNLLLHNSGLIAFVPFYKTYSTKGEVLEAIYNIGLDYPVNTKSIYSDLNAVMLGLLVEKISGMDLNEYCKQNIFIPLDMHSTMFVPEDKYKERILPTEMDNYWRMRLLQGEVHDETTSILGGISGNAGLFSNATDLYKFMRVMLNNGEYYNPYSRGLKEEKLFSPEIISLFTTKYTDVAYENSRALGWDTKPQQNSSKYRIPCGELISENCFGHTGYTGTSIWCDKDRGLIIIFLTNRVYPSRENYGIRDIRPEIHNAAIQIAAG